MFGASKEALEMLARDLRVLGRNVDNLKSEIDRFRSEVHAHQKKLRRYISAAKNRNASLRRRLDALERKGRGWVPSKQEQRCVHCGAISCNCVPEWRKP